MVVLTTNYIRGNSLIIEFYTMLQDNILVLSLSGSLDAITYDEAIAHFDTLV